MEMVYFPLNQEFRTGARSCAPGYVARRLTTGHRRTKTSSCGTNVRSPTTPRSRHHHRSPGFHCCSACLQEPVQRTLPTNPLKLRGEIFASSGAVAPASLTGRADRSVDTALAADPAARDFLRFNFSVAGESSSAGRSARIAGGCRIQDDVGAAERAVDVGAEPGADAGDVERVAAVGEEPE